MQRNGAATNPCKYSGTEAAHRAFVGDDGERRATAATVASSCARRSTREPGRSPGAPFDNYRQTRRDAVRSHAHLPDRGTRAVLKTGVLTTLRLDDPQANQTLRATRTTPRARSSRPSVRLRAVVRREPVHRPGRGGTRHEALPGRGPVVLVHRPCRRRSARTRPTTPGAASSPRRACRPARSATTSPSRPTTAQHQQQLVPELRRCNYDGNYDGKPAGGRPADPNGWVQQGGDSRYPRVVNLFIVPYQGAQGR